MESVISVKLADMNFSKLSMEEKRANFVLMDVMLKKLHEANYMVTDFNPNKIIYSDGYFSFESIAPINGLYAGSREEAIYRNVLSLANLAFCSYLPDYSLKQGLLSFDVIHSHFSSFENILPNVDHDYYKSMLVDSYENGKFTNTDCIYYSEHVIKQSKSSNNKKSSNNLAYLKATEAGKMFASNDEAAFGNYFFIICVVFGFILAVLGLIILVL